MSDFALPFLEIVDKMTIVGFESSRPYLTLPEIVVSD